MARKKDVPARELEICFRLRSFRLATRISRAAFALAVGISSDRLASYELGRVPLRYDIFKTINAQFFINPQWLVTGEGPPANEAPFHDSEIRGLLRDRDLLSTAFDQVIGVHLIDAESNAAFDDFIESAERMVRSLNSAKVKSGLGMEGRRLAKRLQVSVDELAAFARDRQPIMSAAFDGIIRINAPSKLSGKSQVPSFSSILSQVRKFGESVRSAGHPQPPISK